jgi:hypothetical protein
MKPPRYKRILRRGFQDARIGGDVYITSTSSAVPASRIGKLWNDSCVGSNIVPI